MKDMHQRRPMGIVKGFCCLGGKCCATTHTNCRGKMRKSNAPYVMSTIRFDQETISRLKVSAFAWRKVCPCPFDVAKLRAVTSPSLAHHSEIGWRFYFSHNADLWEHLKGTNPKVIGFLTENGDVVTASSIHLQILYFRCFFPARQQVDQLFYKRISERGGGWFKLSTMRHAGVKWCLKWTIIAGLNSETNFFTAREVRGTTVRTNSFTIRCSVS